MVLIQIALSSGRPRDYEYLAQFMKQSGWQTELADGSGNQHPLAPGTYVGQRDNLTDLAQSLQKDIHDSGLDSAPKILTAILQSWTVVN